MTRGPDKVYAVKTTIRLTSETYAAIKHAALKAEVPASEFMRAWIRLGVAVGVMPEEGRDSWVRLGMPPEGRET